MATKPTREQQQACDHLAEALMLICQAARLDGRSRLDGPGLNEIATRIAQVSSAFELETIVARALERRGAVLGLPASAVELLTLMDSDMKPLQMLLLTDEAFMALIDQMRDELGDV